MAKPPRTEVAVTETPPVIDGRLDDVCWQRPPDISEFRQVGAAAPTPAESPTEIWLARNDAWLLIAARCHDENAAEIKCQHLDRDGAVHHDESLEFYISPGTDGQSYYHFRVNARGVQGDTRFEGGRRIEWDGHWRSAGQVDAAGKAWTVELAVPLFYLTQGAGNQAWRLNICRNRDGQKTADSWAILSAFNFHMPEDFGLLTGLEGVRGAPVFAPVITAAKIGNMTDLPERGYEVVMTVKNDGGLPGTAEAAAADVASAGERWTDPRGTDLSAGHEMEMTHWILFEEYEPRSSRARLSLQDALGAWEFTRAISWERSQEPFAADMDRSYYTTETDYYLVYQSPLPEAFLETARIVVSGDILENEVVEAKVRPAGRVRLPFNLVTNGRWRISARLESGSGQDLKTMACDVIKRDPNPAGNTVKIDRWRRCVLVNDEPFFAHGFYGAPPDSYELMKESCGVNAAIVWGTMSSTNLQEALDRAQSNGLYLVTSPVPGVTWAKPNHVRQQNAEGMDDMRKQMLEQMPLVMEAWSRHPALLAYHLLDEPFRTEFVRDALFDIYKAVHDQDGYHPAFTGDLRWTEGDPIWAELCDVGFPHLYWIPNIEKRVPRRHIARWREIQTAGRDLMKPIWLGMVNEFHTLTYRMMTPEERRVAVHLGLIHEFTGIFYFAWAAAHETTHTAIHALARELDVLRPTLLTRTPEQTFAVEGGDDDMVKALLKTHPDGGGVLLTANTLKTPVEIEMVLDGLPDGTQVTSMFDASADTEPRTLARRQGGIFRKSDAPALRVENGTWRDRLEAYGVRAYRIAALPGDDGRPWKIKAVIRNAEEVAAALEDGNVAQNVLANPGFEEDGGWDGWENNPAIASDDTFARSGNRSARLVRDDAQAPPLQLRSAAFVLKPNTRYRFGGWMFGDIRSAPEKWGGPSISLYSDDARRVIHTLATHTQPLQGEWRLRSGFLDTGSEPETIRILILAYPNKYTGTVWVDDLFVEEAPLVRSRNLLPNSGFEHATLAGYPDRWYPIPSTRWLTRDTLTPLPDALIRQDFDEKVEGACSLRLRGYISLNSAPGRWNFSGVRLKGNTDYVFSVYMKADREDYEVRVSMRPGAKFIDGDKRGHAWCKVGMEWKRYSFPARTEANPPRLALTILPVGSMRYDGPAEELPVLRVDAAQFEEGTEPTEYMPDMYNLDNTAWMSLE